MTAPKKPKSERHVAAAKTRWQQPTQYDYVTEVSCSHGTVSFRGLEQTATFLWHLQSICVINCCELSISFRKLKDGTVEVTARTSLHRDEVSASIARVKLIYPDFTVVVSTAPRRVLQTISAATKRRSPSRVSHGH